MRRFLPVIILTVIVLSAGGCRLMPDTTTSSGPTVGPLYVAANSQDLVWERTVDVLHKYPFEVERENRQDGVIETRYKVGSGWLEPWHKESIGSFNRWESTLQSIRRKVVVHVNPVAGGFQISVEALKEMEDLRGLAASSAGGATFQENSPLQRDLNLVVGQTASSTWQPLGRDILLERDIMRRLQKIFSR